MTNTLYPNYTEGKLDDQVRDFLIELSKNEYIPLRSMTHRRSKKKQ